MAPKRIFLTLAAVAVGFLILGTVLTQEAGAWTIYGTIEKESGGHLGSMLACYQKIPGPADCVQASYWYGLFWKYAISDLDNGSYDVWAEYDDGFQSCISETTRVEIDYGDEVCNIYIDDEHCQ